MNPGYLILYPDPASPSPDREGLLAQLSELALIGKPLADRADHYPTGKAFLQLISFLGCSPAIQLAGDPVADAVCSIHLLGPYPASAVLFGSNSRAPRCPACRQPFIDWQAWWTEPQKPEPCCPACGNHSRLESLNWRQQAAVSSHFLAISQVFPGEAVPVDRLIHDLQRDGSRWDYGYVQQPQLWREQLGLNPNPLA